MGWGMIEQTLRKELKAVRLWLIATLICLLIVFLTGVIFLLTGRYLQAFVQGALLVADLWVITRCESRRQYIESIYMDVHYKDK